MAYVRKELESNLLEEPQHREKMKPGKLDNVITLRAFKGSR